MGTKTPAIGGEQKPLVKHEGQPNNQHGSGYNNNCRDNTPRKESFWEQILTFVDTFSKPNATGQNRLSTSPLSTKILKHKSELNETHLFSSQRKMVL